MQRPVIQSLDIENFDTIPIDAVGNIQLIFDIVFKTQAVQNVAVRSRALIQYKYTLRV